MFSTIYIEDEVREHPRALEIHRRFADADIIPCGRYGEVFNRKTQNFRLQKKKPALILAKKYNHFVLPAPAGYGIGAGHNYYFSHMLNCIYDCRYCFLQGMYRSAHIVLFVNFEDFTDSIEKKIAAYLGKEVHFFSGYDCDSLALEPVTGFVDVILPLFRKHPGALLELRTKSTQIRSLLAVPPLDNCVIAFSLTPENIATALEHNAPKLERRLAALEQLQKAGWKIGLRFDPLIYEENYRQNYRRLFEAVFGKLDVSRLHSVSLGNFRLPRDYFKTLLRLYPEEKLFASPLEDDAGIISYKQTIANEMLQFCRDALLSYVPDHIFFLCAPMLQRVEKLTA